MKGKRKRNELKPEIAAVPHTVKNYNIIEPPKQENKIVWIEEFSDNKMIQDELFWQKFRINFQKKEKIEINGNEKSISL